MLKAWINQSERKKQPNLSWWRFLLLLLQLQPLVTVLRLSTYSTWEPSLLTASCPDLTLNSVSSLLLPCQDININVRVKLGIVFLGLRIRFVKGEVCSFQAHSTCDNYYQGNNRVIFTKHKVFFFLPFVVVSWRNSPQQLTHHSFIAT